MSPILSSWDQVVITVILKNENYFQPKTWFRSFGPRHYRHVNGSPLPFTHWASVESAWCCTMPPSSITLTAPEVANTENLVICTWPFLFDPSSIWNKTCCWHILLLIIKQFNKNKFLVNCQVLLAYFYDTGNL